MTEETRKSILDMAMGGIKERCDLEVSKIIDNIIDPNTCPTKKRTLILQLEFVPDDKRQMVAVRTVAKCKLEPTTPLVTSLYVAPDENGEVTAHEMTPKLPGQMDMFGGEQEQPAKLRMIK